MASASIQKMAKLCEGLIDTTDINTWQNGFLKNVCKRVADNKPLSSAQIVELEAIYERHFA